MTTHRMQTVTLHCRGVASEAPGSRGGPVRGVRP